MGRRELNRLILAAEYLLDGRSVAWVAREFGITNLQSSHIAGLLELSGERSSPRPQSLETYDQVEQAILEGWPIGEITRTFGVDRKTVARWFPNRPKMSPEEAGKLAQLYQRNRDIRKKMRDKNEWAFKEE